MNKDSQMPIKAEVIDPNLNKVIPSMNVGLPAIQDQPEKELVTDEALLGLYGEIVNKIKEDTTEITSYLEEFANMVINEGDATSATKEAMVNLVKMKADQSDKLSKVADMMTRVKLKERDTFPRYMAAQQNNTINIGESGSKRALLEAITKAQTKQKEE